MKMALYFFRVIGPKYRNQYRISRSLSILLIGSMMVAGILGKEKSIDENLFTASNSTPQLWQSCITADDLTVFQAKRNFEQMIPKRTQQFEPLNDVVIRQNIELFNQLESTIIKTFDDRQKRELMLLALADVCGAYMYSYFVPAIKYSYYGGFVSQVAVSEALRLLAKYQTMLGSNGSGRRFAGSYWQIDALDPSHFYTQLKPAADERFEPAEHNCHRLSETVSSGSLQPYVEIDEDMQEILLISLPYFHNGTVHNPKSKRAARMLSNYYLEIVRCFASKKDTLEVFQQTFAEWISSHTKYILAKGQVSTLYPAFEAVLQVQKSAENGRKHPKKSITAMNEQLPDDGIDQDSDELQENADATENQPEMSTLKKLSIWIGCSLAVLLVVYIIFQMQQNRKIIANNRFTKRRSQSVEGRRRRSSSKRMLSREVSEEDELTVFDRLEADTNNDGARNSGTGRRKFSLARLMQRIQPRSWKSTAKGYKPVAVHEPSSTKQQRKLKVDHPQPGPSGIKKNQISRSCSCISCIERASLQDSDVSDRPLRTA